MANPVKTLRGREEAELLATTTTSAENSLCHELSTFYVNTPNESFEASSSSSSSSCSNNRKTRGGGASAAMGELLSGCGGGGDDTINESSASGASSADVSATNLSVNNDTGISSGIGDTTHDCDDDTSCSLLGSGSGGSSGSGSGEAPVVLRKLGAAEIVFDYEFSLKGCILPYTLVVNTTHDLLASRDLVDQAVQSWKSLHPFLRSRIVVLDTDTDDNNNSTSTSRDNNMSNNEKTPIAQHQHEHTQQKPQHFSHERYFALATPHQIASMDNVSYYRLEGDGDGDGDGEVDVESSWMLMHEREMNVATVDCSTGPLWRLKFIQLAAAGDRSNKRFNDHFKYAIIFTPHHSITDGRNCFGILNQLLNLIEQHLLDKQQSRVASLSEAPMDISTSIEEQLFANAPEKLYDINPNLKYGISECNKIPASLAPHHPADSCSFHLASTGGRFTRLFGGDGDETIYVSDLVSARDSNTILSKFVAFSFESSMLERLLAACKRHACKLTGCLNLACALATRRLYAKYAKYADDEADAQSVSDQICFHFLANLRPHLRMDNVKMGYWAIVLNGIIEISDEQQDAGGALADDDAMSEWFWRTAKRESDSIHERIGAGELIENAKLDTCLLELIDDDHVFENGSVHFAMSNLGALQQQQDQRPPLIHVEQLYYNTSCAPKRWTSVVFHGLSSINGRLCWSLAYNAQLVSDKCIAALVDNIRDVLNALV